MNLDDHPYVSIYLVGCVFAFCLYFVVIAENYIIDWVFKGNVFKKNLNKIKDPAEQSFKFEAGMFAFYLVIGTISSWLGVLSHLWQIFWKPLAVMRDLFLSVPEEIKLLRFPLMNNPNLSREAVWAYLYAYNIKTGAIPDARLMAWELEEIGDYYPSFNNEVALKTLGSLCEVDQETISNVLAHLRIEKEADDAF